MTRLSLCISTAVFLAVAGLARDAGAQVLPEGRYTSDIGAVEAPGSATFANGAFTIAGSGADVWSTADEFRYVYASITGDVSIVARVTAVQNVNAWTKAGVMVRESLSASSKHAYMMVTPGKGLAFQRRVQTGGLSSHTSGGSGTAPYYVKLSRVGNLFTAAKSIDGVSWVQVGSDTIAMSTTIYIGLAVSSHRDGALATASFSQVRISALPDQWSDDDIGLVGAAGTAVHAAGAFTIAGSGTDVWGSADQFRFAYRTLTGDGAIVSQVTSLEYVNAWSKAGVMMRETLSPSSRHAFMLVSPGKGLAFQRRVSTGGTSAHTSGGAGRAPYYVKLARTGSTFTASKSADGVSWTTVGQATIAMGQTIYVGLAVSSHAQSTLATATFANTAVTVAAPAGNVTTPTSEPTTSTTTSPTTSAQAAPLPDTTVGPTTLRVLHWNVHHGGRRTDGVTDRDGLTTWMASFDADVFSLNELDSLSNLTDIVARLTVKTGMQWHYSYDYGIAVLSRFPIEAKSSCVINPSLGRKIVQAAITVNGRLINIWSAHLDAYSGTTRLAEAKALLACVGPFAEQKIVAGDFNAGATSTEMTLMKQTFVDAWAAAKALGATTNYDGNCDGCTRNGRIDYVFASKAATQLVLMSAQIFDTRAANGVMPSDHKPLLVTYEVR